MKLLIGIILLILAWQFAHAETLYFGNNMFPSCWQEWVCDGIATVICAVGFVITYIQVKKL